MATTTTAPTIPADQRILRQFQVTKLRSWRTGYSRRLVLYEHEFVTYDGTKETNRWKYGSIQDAMVVVENNNHAILLDMGGRGDTLKLQCTSPPLVLAALLQQQAESGQSNLSKQTAIFPQCIRWKRNGTQQSVLLHIQPFGMTELDTTSRQIQQTYYYHDLAGLSFPNDGPPDTVVFTFTHLPNKNLIYTIGRQQRAALVQTIHDAALAARGSPLQVEPSRSMAAWRQQRLSPTTNTSSTGATFAVTKPTSRRRPHAIPRLVVVTPTRIREHDTGSHLVSSRPLSHLRALVVQPGSVQLEWINGTVTTYRLTVQGEHGALVVSIVDAAPWVVVAPVTTWPYCVDASTPWADPTAATAETTTTTTTANVFAATPTLVQLFQRVQQQATHVWSVVCGEFAVAGDDDHHQNEVVANELHTYVQTLAESPPGIALVTACREFAWSGSTNCETLLTVKRPVVQALAGIAVAVWKVTSAANTSASAQAQQPRYTLIAALLEVLQRLLRIQPKFGAEVEPLREIASLMVAGSSDLFCTFHALQVLQAILTGKADPQQRDMETEFVNKNVLLQSGGPALREGLVQTLGAPSDLHRMVATDILQSLLCSHQDTTSPEHFSALLDRLATQTSALLTALRASSTPYVLENTALLLHLLSYHASEDTTTIRDAALSSGLVLEHFYHAVFGSSAGQRFLSRYLCSQWLTDPRKRLLRRMVPSGFLSYLQMPMISRVEEDQLDALERDFFAETTSATSAVGAGGTNTARLRKRMGAVGTKTSSKNGQQHQQQQQHHWNFRIFFHVLSTQDSNLADLIWNAQTRRELRIALESEMDVLARRRRETGNAAIAWNHQQFRVPYPSLDNEVQVGNGVYMRLWLQAGDGFIKSWEEPVRLLEHLFRRFLCEVDRNVPVTLLCIQCLERLYAHHAATIGPFTDMMMLVHSMVSTRSVETQHRLLGLVASILSVDDMPENAEQLMCATSIAQLCQFVAWGHTAGDVVGNMLTRVLGTDGQRPMLTDGSDRGPTGDGGTPAPVVAGDLACPAVWFVASTGRVPPPPETVRGPFRVSDLLRMMEAGELSQFDLVTTSQVEEYDGGLDGSDEAQIDTGKWKRLNQVWQLRWQLCTDGTTSEIYSPSDVTLLAIKSLTRLVDLHESLDPRGIPYYPIPIAKRILSGSAKMTGSDESNSISNPLPVLCQSLLCNDSRIVEQTAELISKLCYYNTPATSKLYLTGVFLFALNYTGSNFKSLARLLHATHLSQHFRSGFAAAASEEELPMKDRSILGNLLPEGLLYILTNYGYERFSEIFVGNADTPEVIWTFEMRKHLIEMIRQHLGDFPLRLFQNNTTEYEYCPMPGVAYKRLEQEIFCHNYYLHNLCDEERFPDWPVAEPVEVFRACLEHFKREVERDGSAEEERLERARKVLNLDVGDGSKELRKAYRQLARKFHPDKNPTGRETFVKIQTSYELLLPLVERGEKIRVFSEGGEQDKEEGDAGYFPVGRIQMETMHLLIKAQLLICRRFESEMSRLKYPSYPVLLECIKVSSSNAECTDAEILNHIFANEERAVFVKSAVELIYRTCLISPENAEGLVAENGTVLLSELLEFYLRLLKIQKNAEVGGGQTSAHIIADIISCTVHTLSGVAFYDSGRQSIKNLPSLQQLLINWLKCVNGGLFASNSSRMYDSAIKRHALEGIPNLAQDNDLQCSLVGCGMLWPLLRYILVFDPTLETTSAVVDDQDDVSASLKSTNIVAGLSARGLGCLSGQFGNCPDNDEILCALSTLLTPPIARMLRNKRSLSVLHFLNSNVERADIIWNVQMRTQLESFLRQVENERPAGACQSLITELEPIKGFQYDMLANEVRLGGIYVRFFNKGGNGSLSHVEDPTAFFRTVVHFIGTSLNASMDTKAGWFDVGISPVVHSEEMPAQYTDGKFLLALEALQILCRVDGLPENVLSYSEDRIPSVFLGLLELPVNSETFDVACDVLYVLSSQGYFADAVASDNSLWRLLVVLERADSDESTLNTSDASISKRKSQAWSILESLSSSPSIANKILASSCWIELLGVLVGYPRFTKVWLSRLGAAKSLSRLLWDPHTGTLAESLLVRFLPTTLIVGLKDDSESMVKSFDSNSDTPELIWDGSMRTELRQALSTLLDSIMKSRAENDRCHNEFELTPDSHVSYSKLEKELNIGGVYVSRFLKEPTYNLRDPGSFLELLLQRWGKELESFVSPSEQVPITNTTDVTEAGQDTLDLITTASVYVCRTREVLCDKLATWGYMARCMTYLQQVVERNLIGSPLLAVMRLLHVASSRKVNVESLALLGLSDGRRGVVEFTLQAIACNELHRDTAFMVEFLKKSYQLALGDLNRVGFGSSVMAPSYAPGEGPTRRKVNVGDDPLGMFQSAPQPVSPPQPVQQVGPVHLNQQTPVHQFRTTQGQMRHQSSGYPQPMSYVPGQRFENPVIQQQTPPQSMRYELQPNGIPLNSGQPQTLSSNGRPLNFPPRSQPLSQSHQQQSHVVQFDSYGQRTTTFPSQATLQTPQSFVHPLTGETPGYNTSQRLQEQGNGGAKAAQERDYQQRIAEIQRQKESKPKSKLQKFMDDGKQGLSSIRGVVGQASGGLFTQGESPQSNTGWQGDAQGQNHGYQQQPVQSFTPAYTDPQAHNPRLPQTQPPWIQQQGPQQPSQYSQHQSLAARQTSQKSHSLQSSQTREASQYPNQYQQPVQYNNSPNNPGRGTTVGGHPTGPLSPYSGQYTADLRPGRFSQSHVPLDAQPQYSTGGPPFPQQQGAGQPHEPNHGSSGVGNTHNQMGSQSQEPFPSTQMQNGIYVDPNAGRIQIPQDPFGGQAGHQGSTAFVETVEESGAMHIQQQEPTAMEGSGVDGRTPEDPNVVAAMQAATIPGAPGAIQGRVSLLQQAIACNLCEFLVNNVLENSGLDKIRDPAGAKVHSIELLKMLSKDPGFGGKFKIILDDLPAWKKYKSQDHSLLITGHEQKADYFLTNGDSAGAKLLTN